jgi:hypothetical protein
VKCVDCGAAQSDVSTPPIAGGLESLDQPGMFEHAEVVRQQVRRQREQCRQFGRCTIADGELVDDRQAHGFPERSVDLRPALDVSIHVVIVVIQE